MESLDDVIKAIEECRDSYVAGKIIKSDALYYLKEYQNAKNALNIEREELIEAYCQWKDAKEKLEAQTSQMMWVDNRFQFEISDNPPLTWDELKAMKGKPVWVEDNIDGPEKSIKCWAICRGIEKTQITEYALLCDFCYDKAEYGKTWQVYKKERE